MKGPRKAIALIFGFMVIVVLLLLSMAVLTRSVSENRLASRNYENAQTFWLAEAGMNRALDELRADFTITAASINGGNPVGFGEGDYRVASIETIDLNTKRVTVSGYIPSSASPREQRTIVALINQEVPDNFYDNVLYSAGDIDINGAAYSVAAEDTDGDTIPDGPATCYAGNLSTTDDEAGIQGTNNPTAVSPLPRLDFEQLLAISQGQDNVYDVLPNGDLVEPGTNNDKPLPDDFWFTDPPAPDGVDNDGDGEVDEEGEGGVPNVVYINGNLVLNGTIEVGGFFVVVGDVINNPDEVFDSTVNGNGTINGCVYTRGEFRINGGGGADLNLNGGAWSGTQARLNGSVNAAYNRTFMDAVRGLNIDPIAQVTAWQEIPFIYDRN
ncbi:MAG: hypothetical protein JSW40_00760 [Candidatus Omnitrophota bacterium]|nr:MAG: hypothetical protein JSW40_00760 [Candidatus Omnitrophota bacterium]